MAGNLFSHILNHLKSKQPSQPSYDSQSSYLLTPQKSGAFTRLTPFNRDNDMSATTTTSVAPRSFGPMIVKPKLIYISSSVSENNVAVRDVAEKDECPNFGGVTSFE